jgi:pyrroline-5-carboxylate reductase
MKNYSLGFIGGGRVTRVILKAFQNKEIDLKSAEVFDTDKNTCENLKLEFADIKISDINSLANQEIVFLALHPPVIMETLKKIAETLLDDTIIISLSPKITIGHISSVLKRSKKIFRLIPNATSYINEGYNPVCFSNAFSPEEKGNIISWLSLMGKTFEVQEVKLEAFAIISAMLPTYFWFQWQKLYEIGREIGLSEDESREAIYFTLNSAVNILLRSGLNTSDVMDLIPVKPIGEHEVEIKQIFEDKLLALYHKLKPVV